LNLKQRQRGLINYITASEGEPPSGIEYVERLSVYQQGFVARMMDALVETFEVSAFILGGVRFKHLVAGYVENQSIAGFDISTVCDGFHEYILKQSYSEFEFFPDLVALEYLSSCSFHANDSSPLW